MFPDLGTQYEFIKTLGSGGTAAVHLALDKHSGFLVAIKTLFKDHLKDKETLEKFKSEANIYLMLDHPNIVSLKDFIIKKDSIHLVQEYVDGQTLGEYIQEVTGPISLGGSIAIIKDIISAISHAHNKNIPLPGYNGILHLDLKPSNVMISKSGSVKIIDYGISQGNDENRGEKIMGTPMYMAPEQLNISKRLDKRTDIYALGVLLHEMVTGSKPYSVSNKTTNKEMGDLVNNTPLLRTEELYPSVDRRFQKIIDKATNKNPDNRHQSCQQLFEAIEELEV